jgi:hypothetical protein
LNGLAAILPVLLSWPVDYASSSSDDPSPVERHLTASVAGCTCWCSCAFARDAARRDLPEVLFALALAVVVLITRLSGARAKHGRSS